MELIKSLLDLSYAYEQYEADQIQRSPLRGKQHNEEHAELSQAEEDAKTV